MLGLAAIAPAPATAKDDCSVLSANFRLVAKPISDELKPSVEGWGVSSYHIGACYDYAVLEGNADYSRAFYVNGTAKAVKHQKSDVLTDGGTPAVPYGIIVPGTKDVDEEGRRAVQINCGDGTAGVQISRRHDTTPHLAYQSGSWYACNTSLPYGPAVVVYYRDSSEHLPDECIDIRLDTQW
jgi:hypothetical protein